MDEPCVRLQLSGRHFPLRPLQADERIQAVLQLLVFDDYRTYILFLYMFLFHEILIMI